MTKTSSSFGISAGLNACALAAGLLLAGCGGGGGTGDTSVAPLALETPPTAASAPAAVATTPASSASEAVAGVSVLAADVIARPSAIAACTTGNFGSFQRPFSPDSPWNSRPIGAVLGTATIPTSTYYPSVDSGTWSSAAFEASETDPPMVVTGTNTQGVWDPDSEVYRPSITIPHWPAQTQPATGSDGHAEIVDAAAGVIHSFWGLKQVNGAWVTNQYAWTPLAGRGMGDPSHYYQGARAAGVSTIGGLIRIHEANDGAASYSHALAMSLDFTGLSNSPTYRFPATSADSNAATTNSGQIPMGSLLMLPASFDAQALATPELRKIAETLKKYGAYVVDRNHGTPFVIYVEIGADLKLHKNGWSSSTATDLDTIRAALRPLESAAWWVDGNNKNSSTVTSTAMNLLSMRGAWWRTKGTVSGEFDTWRQALVFPATTTLIEQANATGRAMNPVSWALPVAGDPYRLTVAGTGGATFRMTIADRQTGATVYDTGYLADGAVLNFTWPAGTSFKVTTWGRSGTANVESTLRPTLVRVSGATGSVCAS
ncbi:Atrophin-1 multi-domain protein [Roseateles chitinivorans]|uniref:Atrophin-1 multi-domain protein n=1 Tax=Roseateles chitinivorans TaxID=2917965 RepID=UPI0018ED3037|nr:Atrophin-1 multi-domain protein [Roseateles chitinivorans]